MSNEINKNIKKGNKTEKPYYPYALWELFRSWLAVLFLMFFMFPTLLFQVPAFFGMIFYTMYFLLKRERYIKQKKEGYVKKS